MKKITIEECESLNVSTIVWQLKYQIISEYPDISIKEMASLLANKLKNLSEKSLSNEFAGLPSFHLLFTTTRCYLGGVRYWFLCPTCDRRIGKLYAPLSADEFRCRHCHNLTYRSSQTHNQRIKSLSRQLDEVYKKEGDEALTQTISKVMRTHRGRRLLDKVCDKRTTSFPPPFLARMNKENEGYKKYIKLLSEV